MEFLDVLSQTFAETWGEFKRPLIGDKVHNVPGSVHEGFTVMAFVEMGFKEGLKLRVQLAVYEGGDKLPNRSAANFNNQHSWPSFPDRHALAFSLLTRSRPPGVEPPYVIQASSTITMRFGTIRNVAGGRTFFPSGDLRYALAITTRKDGIYAGSAVIGLLGGYYRTNCDGTGAYRTRQSW